MTMPDQIYAVDGQKWWEHATTVYKTTQYTRSDIVQQGMWTPEMKAACMADAAAVCRLTEENQEMREVLEFYAAKYNYIKDYCQSTRSLVPENIMQDKGDKARAILAKHTRPEVEKHAREADKRMLDKAIETYDPNLKTSIGAKHKGGES